MIMFEPPHPGEILKEYTEATGKSITEIAGGLGVSRKNLSQILNGHTGISAEMAVKLSVAFDTTPGFWLNLQNNYDLWIAKQNVDISKVKNFIGKAA